jgi:RimJ/RimL family protein N-acetyltransferase
VKNLLLGHDDQVANWAFTRFGYERSRYDMAVGIVDDGSLVAAALFHSYNGPDVEISYYGPKTMTLGVVKQLAKLAVEGLGVSRITARTAKNNKAMKKGIKKIGFEFEGVRHNAYGKYDALMYGLYGANLAKLAGQAVH